MLKNTGFPKTFEPEEWFLAAFRLRADPPWPVLCALELLRALALVGRGDEDEEPDLPATGATDGADA